MTNQMIYLLDKYARGDSGHYWVSGKLIRRALSDLKIPFLYINPSADQAQTEDMAVAVKFGSYRNLPETPTFTKEALSIIEEDLQDKSLDHGTIILNWIPQFTMSELSEIEEYRFSIDIKLAGITLPTSNAIQGKTSPNRYYGEELLDTNSRMNLLWVGEDVPETQRKKGRILQLPDYIENQPASKNRNYNRLCFYGQLSAYRGLTEILLIALFNPKLKIAIKGYGFSPRLVWRPIKFRIFRYKNWRDKPWLSVIFSAISLPLSLLRFLPNIDFSKKPFPSEDDLGLAISNAGGIFYCPKLPHGSGITMKSLYSGIPVIWNGNKSQAQTVLQSSYPVGHFKYFEIFIPGRIRRKLLWLNAQEGNFPLKPYQWSDYLNSIAAIKK